MIFKANINTEMKLYSVKYLNNFKILANINNWDKLNFGKSTKQLVFDRRTVKYITK